jgi:hypothetical protein
MEMVLNNKRSAITLVILMGFGSLCFAQDPESADWNWSAPTFQVYYTNSNGQIVNQTIIGPYNSSDSGVYENDKMKCDLWKEDGWMLVCKDFGTPVTAPSMPFMVLYNKF